MREYHLLQLLERHFVLDCHAHAVDYLRARVAHHMGSEHLVVLLAHDELAYSFRMFVFGYEASGVGHRQLDYGVIPAACLGLLFGQTDSRHFRIGVNYARDCIVAHMVLLAEYVVNGDFAFAACGVREHGESCHVTGGIDSRNVGAHPVVHLDSARLAAPVEQHLHSEALEPVAADVCPAADAHEYLVTADPADLSVRVLVHDGVALNAGNLAAKVELYASLGVNRLKRGAYLVVERPEYLRQHLHYGNLGPESVVECGEFHSYHAAADYDQLLRLLLEREYLPVGHDDVSGFLQTRNRWHHSLGTCAD